MYFIHIKNPRNGLSKIVDATKYTLLDVKKTFDVYLKAGFEVYIKSYKRRVV